MEEISVSAKSSRPRIVIIGAGFGGLSAVIGLKPASVDVTVVDRRNHHLFRPCRIRLRPQPCRLPTSLSRYDISWRVGRTRAWYSAQSLALICRVAQS